MNETNKTAEQALSKIREQRWMGPSFDSELENRLMDEFTNNRSRTGWMGRHRILVSLVAVLMIGGVGLAGAAGTEAIEVAKDVAKKVLSKLRLVVDTGEGEEMALIELEYDGELEGESLPDDVEGGAVQSFAFRMTPNSGDAEARLEQISLGSTKDRAAARNGGEEEGQLMTVSIACEDDEASVAAESVLLAHLDLFEAEEEWVDQGGEPRALYVVPAREIGDANAQVQVLLSGLDVFFTYVDVEGGSRVQHVGHVPDVDAERTWVNAIEWADDVATITLVSEGGAEQTVTVTASPPKSARVLIEIDTGTLTVEDDGLPLVEEWPEHEVE